MLSIYRMSNQPSKSAGQVQTLRNLDLRRMWGKMHNSNFRDNCYAYYREATFAPTTSTGSGMHQRPSSRLGAGQQVGIMRRLINGATERKAVLALLGVLGLGIGVTRFLATNSQTNSPQRVEAYVDSLRSDWEQYQKKLG